MTKHDSLFRRPIWPRTHRHCETVDRHHPTSKCHSLGGVYLCINADNGDGLASIVSNNLRCLDDDTESTDITSAPSTEYASSLSSSGSTWSVTDEDFSGKVRQDHRYVLLEGVDTSVSGNSSSMNVDSETVVLEWKSSGDVHHHDGSPLIVLQSAAQRIIDPNYPGLELGDDEVHRKVMLNARKLPKAMGGLASLHVILNNERFNHQIAPLQRIPSLDELAQRVAAKMSSNQELKHCNPNEILNAIVETGNSSLKRVGINILICDGDIAGMHHRMMKESLSDRNNVLDRRFTTLGVATSKASNGSLYVCQLFLG
jgi:hypothetical protein